MITVLAGGVGGGRSGVTRATCILSRRLVESLTTAPLMEGGEGVTVVEIAG